MEADDDGGVWYKLMPKMEAGYATHSKGLKCLFDKAMKRWYFRLIQKRSMCTNLN